MESLKSKKFKSFEKDQVMKLNLIRGGVSNNPGGGINVVPDGNTGSTWTSATAHGTDSSTDGGKTWTYITVK